MTIIQGIISAELDLKQELYQNKMWITQDEKRVIYRLMEKRESEYQQRITDLEAELKRKDEALMSIRNLHIRSDIHPSAQGDKAIEIAQEALKIDNNGN